MPYIPLFRPSPSAIEIIYKEGDLYPDQQMITVPEYNIDSVDMTDALMPFIHDVSLTNDPQKYTGVYVFELRKLNELPDRRLRGEIILECSLPLYKRFIGTEKRTFQTARIDFSLLKQKTGITFANTEVQIFYNRNSQNFIGTPQRKIGATALWHKRFQVEKQRAFPLGISVEKVADASADQEDLFLHFEAPTSTPDLGTYTTSVYVFDQEEAFYGKVSVALKVVDYNIEHFRPNLSADWNFCLDPNAYIDVQRSSPQARYLKMELSMQFQNNHSFQTLTQVYEYYLKDTHTRVFPGEEIHDFFQPLSLSGVEPTQIISTSQRQAITPRPLFSLAQVNILMSFYDQNWQPIFEQDLGTSYWLPGKKPKAFPYLTNGNLRSTYTDSMLSVCAVQQQFTELGLWKICSPLADNSAITQPNWVVQANFSRSTADENYGAYEIIQYQGLTLFPVVNPNRTIHVIFENQNLCPDWFSFAENYTLQSEMEHLISKNLSKGRKFKANVETTQTLTLNTGWILTEEIELLEELIAGGICFVNTEEGKWVKCIPLSKKPLKFDSERRLHQQLVEFEVVNS